mmetsp:Transcript_15464/g.23182  ORF Transcript_15464/g.23182 Transcript_15464/m.23182 type:complete len:350 (+) Transcript_15464:38-1087(+)|eukprot:CAMPEP_0201552762 /NCGR_PEP_ID=MMETSP0173_2-20130828/17634_1 /ASSEMBLY_ACC=CAM_ASM_000268 /TAXON_ID=218659 /ORGANISM="Vexillifera sp., Strain DIVA3 564/2" /LENGTH=349 /DNA_ID=CAMNT_0047963305 /DNA_START=32 /DNA_END=1081 /DNA_ORIENTATION=-
MGGCVSGKERTQQDKELTKQNKLIEQQLRDDRKDREIKLLLLGPGESGKSTVAKQMKILHLKGFSQEELENYRPIMYHNIISCIKELLRACSRFRYPIETQNEPIAELLMKLNPIKVNLSPQLGKQIFAMWKDKGVQKSFARRNEFQLIDICKYAMENIDRICAENYVPTEQDVLRCRCRTSGIVETPWSLDGIRFRMVDVGGQRSERKKWIHCFQDVNSLIFCVALSEYDMNLFEDESVNRMYESIELYEEIVTSNWFRDTPVILFLNKSDIFQEKIVHKDLKCCFPDYTGGCDFLNATQYLQEKFLAIRPKHVYPHITCATDTENIRFVFNAIKDIIVMGNLTHSGF